MLAGLSVPLGGVAGADAKLAELYDMRQRRDLVAALTIVNETILSAANTSVGSLDPQFSAPLAPRVASYRNAYGSQFSCGSTCLFIAGTYSTLVCSLLLLVCLVPLQQRVQSADAAATRFWFGGKGYTPPEEDNKPTPATGDRERGCWATAVLWVARHVLPRGAVVRDEEDICDHFHEDYLSVTQALAGENQQKTYESIGVATDDLPFPGFGSGDDVIVGDDPERLFDSPVLGQRARSKRASIFSSSPPPPPPPSRRTQRSSRLSIASASPDPREAASAEAGSETVIVPERSSFVGSAPASPVLDITPDFIEQHRRMTLTGYQLAPSESKEDMVRAVERRASIQHRAEKRREIAKSDISYENLGDEEIQMYEYLEFVRQLLEGIALKKVCQSSSMVVKRTFFVNAEMTTVFWNKVGNKKWMTRKSSIQVSAIDKVLKGLDGNPGLASRGAMPEKSSLYMSILCTDGKRLDLEANDEPARQRLFLGFSRLAMEKRLSAATHPSDEGPSAVGLPSTEPTNLSPVRRATQRSPTHSSQLDQVMEEEEEEEKDDEHHRSG